MSFEALNIGASALYAAQRAAEVSAQNVANAANDNYTRQKVTIQAAPPSIGYPGMRGTGVQMMSITRVRDSLADVAYRAQAAPAGAADARSNVLSRAETILGPYAQGVPDSLDKFFSAWNTLSLNPTDSAARSAVLAQGNVLAGSLNDAATNLNQIEDDTFNQVQQNVTQVNTLATQVATLNKQIATAVVGGQNPNDLLDQRDAAIDQLSALTGASVRVSGATQQAQIYVGGQLLVDSGSAEQLQTGRSGTDGTVSFTLNNTTVSPQGTLGGLSSVLNTDLPGFGAHLDAIANGIATQVNAVHSQGYNMVDPSRDASDNLLPPTGGNFFSGTTAATLKVALTSPGQIAASTTGNVNDGNNAIALANVANAPAFGYSSDGVTPVPLAAGAGTPGDLTIGDAVRGLVGRLGTASANAQAVQQATASSRDAAQSLRSDADGVSTDEEMVDLVKYQHSYEAAARVITVADSMLDTLINHTGTG